MLGGFCGSVTKQLVKRALGFLHPLVRTAASRPVALREVEVLTEVRPVFFRHRLGAPLAALVRHSTVVKHAIEASAQIPQIGRASWTERV